MGEPKFEPVISSDPEAKPETAEIVKPQIISRDSGVQMIDQWLQIIEANVAAAEERRAQSRTNRVYKSDWHKHFAKPPHDDAGIDVYGIRASKESIRWIENNIAIAQSRGVARYSEGKLELLPLSAEQLPETLVHVSDFYRVLGLRGFDDKHMYGEIVELKFDAQSKELVLLNRQTGQETKVGDLYGKPDPNRPFYIANGEAMDKVVLDIRGYGPLDMGGVSLELASKFFKFATFYIDRERLTSLRNVYLDPEAITHKRFDQEFGHTYFITGGLPLECVEGVIQGYKSGMDTGINVFEK